MIQLNENYLKLASSYLFSEIAKRVSAFQQNNPDRELIRLGIGDVTLPLTSSVISAFHEGVDDMSKAGSFRGYGPEQGYDFLKTAIARNDYEHCNIHPGEIFISDGSKCDTGNIQELFAQTLRIGVPDPVYPVYVDTNVMAGRTGGFIDGRYEGLFYLESTDENGFVPEPPAYDLDLIYLCFPNNPTGACATKQQLQSWVEYAKSRKALILFDAAYVAFIRDPELPRSIFEIEGAKEVAIEFRSYSKTAGFTGTRCAYTVIPDECLIYDSQKNSYRLNQFWNRRHTTKFNGVSYPVQKAAASIYTAEGAAQVKSLVDYYLENAKIIREALTSKGYLCCGGDNSPYIWVKTSGSSWDFFDHLLSSAGVVCTPGAGFGKCGEGYIRISAFNSLENVKKAISVFPKKQ